MSERGNEEKQGGNVPGPSDRPDGRVLIPRPNGGALLTPWQPGQSGNPRGVRTAGASYRQWLNALTGDTYSEADLERIAFAPKTAKIPPMKRRAAKTILRADTDGFSRAGKPLDGDDLDRIADRTEGLPVKRVESLAVSARAPIAIETELAQALAAHPAIGALLASGSDGSQSQPVLAESTCPDVSRNSETRQTPGQTPGPESPAPSPAEPASPAELDQPPG